MKSGIRLSKMIVTSSHSESGCHEDSMLLLRFDRVNFKVHLPISLPSDFKRFVDYTLENPTGRLPEGGRPAMVGTAGGTLQEVHPAVSASLGIRRGCDVDKDAWAKKQLALAPVLEGLIGVLAQEHQGHAGVVPSSTVKKRCQFTCLAF
jgi:hypothetical protein